MLLTHTDDCGQICCSASRSNLEGYSHSRQGPSHILGWYASSPHCAKVGLVFYGTKWLIASDIYFLDYVLSDFLNQTHFVLKKVKKPALWFLLLNSSLYQGLHILAAPSLIQATSVLHVPMANLTGQSSWSQHSSTQKTADPSFLAAVRGCSIAQCGHQKSVILHRWLHPWGAWFQECNTPLRRGPVCLTLSNRKAVGISHGYPSFKAILPLPILSGWSSKVWCWKKASKTQNQGGTEWQCPWDRLYHCLGRAAC